MKMANFSVTKEQFDLSGIQLPCFIAKRNFFATTIIALK